MRIEIADAFRSVYAIPAGPYTDHVMFSGGSRFDAEFMIKLDAGMLGVLERDLKASTKNTRVEDGD